MGTSLSLYFVSTSKKLGARDIVVFRGIFTWPPLSFWGQRFDSSVIGMALTVLNFEFRSFWTRASLGPTTTCRRNPIVSVYPGDYHTIYTEISSIYTLQSLATTAWARQNCICVGDGAVSCGERVCLTSRSSGSVCRMRVWRTPHCGTDLAVNLL